MQLVELAAPQEALAGVPHAADRGNAIERALGLTMAALGGALVVIELLILGWGVFERYVMDSPSIWSDEAATILFIWLSMIGAVLALRRSEHMRLTAAVDLLPLLWRPRIAAFAHMMNIVYLAFGTWLAWQYTIGQLDFTTQALEISDSWRVSALPIGFALMLLIELSRLERFRTRHLGAAALVIAVVAGLLWAFEATWLAMGPMSLAVFFGPVVAVIIFAGVPISFSFGSATLAYLYFSTHTPLTVMLNRADVGMSNILLLAVPLFIFLGLLIEVTGMAKNMVGFLATLLGHVKGGLEYVLLGAMFLVSGISGSKVADMAAVAPILFPEMKKRGNDEGRMIALLAASGAMTETIPPSLGSRLIKSTRRSLQPDTPKRQTLLQACRTG